MINYEKFQFASPPRTGTSWFINLCAQAQIGAGNPAKHLPPPPTWKNGWVLSIVRHPVDWAVSMYFALRGGMIAVPEVDAVSAVARESSDIQIFLEKLSKSPGIIETAFAAYRADSVIRLEDVPWAAIEFLVSMGYSEKTLKAIPNLNEPKNRLNPKVRADVPKELRKAVIQSELAFCERYEYFY